MVKPRGIQVNMFGIGIYLLGLVFSEALRTPRRSVRPAAGANSAGEELPARVADRVVLAAIVVSMWVLPGIYACTHLLDRFTYAVPTSVSFAAAVLFVGGLAVRGYAHWALGAMWSPTASLQRNHTLVTSGIYRHVRHPIYTSSIIWAICQPVLLPNVVAGWSGALAVLLLWIVRVPMEEEMMRRAFGVEYEQYVAHTGRVFPKLRPRSK
jgi:protein-S-isoprenylcysteine O-methyltransferase Ste14